MTCTLCVSVTILMLSTLDLIWHRCMHCVRHQQICYTQCILGSVIDDFDSSKIWGPAVIGVPHSISIIAALPKNFGDIADARGR